MDVLIDILPSANRVKTEDAKKDKRQRNKYSRQMTSTRYKTNTSYERPEPELNDAELKEDVWDGPERRKLKDRRQLQDQRGRWLESRDRKDRRKVKYAISVKI